MVVVPLGRWGKRVGLRTTVLSTVVATSRSPELKKREREESAAVRV